ncbi:MAG: hypothetical protein MR440_05090 [Firmicutes bacterium]|nr:hypothetical protein [Bacillota bacterium]
MLHNILAFAPLILLIAMALITKKMAESMVISVFFATILLYRQNSLDGFLDMAYDVLADSSFQFVLFVMIGFGGLITLFQESGALMGFRDFLDKYASGPKKSMFLAWVMSFIMFVDEYLNALTVTFSMRDITDKSGIPREHLAFQAHAMACCLCMTIPFTSWTAFTVGLISEYGLGFYDYVESIPYMFFPLLMLVLCLLLIFGLFPKVGEMKRAYQRVENGGPALLIDEKADKLVDVGSVDEEKVSSELNAIIPLVVLIAGVLLCDNDLLHGLVLALLAQFVLYVGQKIMTLAEFFENFFNGAKSMTSLAIVIGFGFILSRENRDLGMFDILINGFGGKVPAFLLPLIAFILVGLTTFAVGSCWVVMTISIPIFMPIALSCGVPPVQMIAAVMSGVAMGFSLCFYADTVFMTTAGTGVSNIAIIKTTIPYAIGIIILTAIGFVICGISAMGI